MTETIDVLTNLLTTKFNVLKPINGRSKIEEIGLDSLDVVNFLYTVERTMGVKIPDEAIVAENLETLEDLARYVDSRRG